MNVILKVMTLTDKSSECNTTFNDTYRLCKHNICVYIITIEMKIKRDIKRKVK